MRNIRASGRDVVFTPAGYLKSQIFLMTPVTFPVWFLGALYFFFWRDGKAFRLLGWTFLTVLVVFIVAHGKDYYAMPGGFRSLRQAGQSSSSNSGCGAGWRGSRSRVSPWYSWVLLRYCLCSSPYFRRMTTCATRCCPFRSSRTRRACWPSRCHTTIPIALAGRRWSRRWRRRITACRRSSAPTWRFSPIILLLPERLI